MRAQLPCSRSRSLPPTATLNGIGFPDPRRLPSTRNRAGSSRSVPSIFQDGTTDHDAPSPIADSPRRARPCPSLSAATESGFLGQAPLADFCNHFSQNTGTPSDRPFLARSSPFRRSSLPQGYRGCERHGTGQLFWSRPAGVRRRRPHRPESSEPAFARGGARGRLEYLPSTSCHRPALRGTC
jgi:hypothetical protein